MLLLLEVPTVSQIANAATPFDHAVVYVAAIGVVVLDQDPAVAAAGSQVLWPHYIIWGYHMHRVLLMRKLQLTDVRYLLQMSLHLLIFN